jgi:hypothetical protein
LSHVTCLYIKQVNWLIAQCLHASMKAPVICVPVTAASIGLNATELAELGQKHGLPPMDRITVRNNHCAVGAALERSFSHGVTCVVNTAKTATSVKDLRDVR